MTDREKLYNLMADSKNPAWPWFPNNAEMLRFADHLIANGVTIQQWIPVTERLPENFVSVLGYMTDAGPFPPVRECYTIGKEFYFPALLDVHPVSHWMPLPEPPKEV